MAKIHVIHENDTWVEPLRAGPRGQECAGTSGSNVKEDGMQYFVTGATGFIGKRLVRKLLDRRGSTVHFLLRPESAQAQPGRRVTSRKAQRLRASGNRKKIAFSVSQASVPSPTESASTSVAPTTVRAAPRRRPGSRAWCPSRPSTRRRA